MAGANLTGAHLFSSTLTNANLAGANLTNASVGSCASAIWLWSRQPISLRMLRWIEAGLFGVAIIYFGGHDIAFF